MLFHYRTIVKPMAMAALCIGAASCQKQDTVCGVEISHGGTGIGSPYPTKYATFYVNKDYQHGTMSFTRLYNATLQQDQNLNGTSDISTFYSSGAPLCGAKGSAYLKIIRGCEYEYTLSSADNIRVTGTFTLDCTDTCQKILIQ